MVGNCIKTDMNFVGALQNYDTLAVMFEIERPQAAIVDPGRIKIRQVSPFVVTANAFFREHYWGLKN